MFTLLRIMTVLAGAALFLAAWHLFPEILTGKLVTMLTSTPALVLSLGLLVLRKLSGLSGAGLNEREVNRLMWKKADARHRLYRMGGFALATLVALSFIFAKDFQTSSPLLAALTGALVGLMFQYLIVLLKWLEQVSAFQDEQERRATIAKQRESTLKALGI